MTLSGCNFQRRATAKASFLSVTCGGIRNCSDRDSALADFWIVREAGRCVVVDRKPTNSKIIIVAVKARSTPHARSREAGRGGLQISGHLDWSELWHLRQSSDFFCALILRAVGFSELLRPCAPVHQRAVMPVSHPQVAEGLIYQLRYPQVPWPHSGRDRHTSWWASRGKPVRRQEWSRGGRNHNGSSLGGRMWPLGMRDGACADRKQPGGLLDL
jgi:hypothetical protein